MARRDHEDVPPLSISSQIGHFIKWKRAKSHPALMHEAGYLVLGLVSLATVTGLYFWLDVALVSTALTYLVVLVLLSLVSDFYSLIVLSFIGVGCLNYFFTPPLFSFRVDYPQDVIALSAFAMTSLVISFLVTRVRAEQHDHVRTSETLRDANERLKAANIALRIENVERKQAEQALREREAKMRRLVDANIIGTFIWDVDGRILEANKAFIDIVGYDHEDLVAGRMRWTDLTPPEWRDRDTQLLQEQKVTGALQPFEKEYFRKDGSRVPVLIGGATFEEGGTQGVALVIDLTERKRAEAALRDSEEALRRNEAWLTEAQRLSHTGTWVLNPTTMQYLYWSDESYRIWGFDPLQGLPSRDALWQRIHDRDRVWEEVQEALRQKKDYSGELKIVLPDGTVKYLAVTSHHLFSANGDLVEVIGTNVDVTERKRAEEALRVSERRSRSAIDGIAGLLAIMAPDGEVETVNRQCLEYFGRPLEWLAKWGTNDAVHPEDLPRVVEIFKSATASGIPYHIEQRLRRFDGEYRWFDTRGVPVRDDSGRIARWYVLITDIEDRTRALARVEQMQSDLAHMNRVSMMGELTASLSHEISQPFASARNNARAAQNFLDKQPPDLREAREALSGVVDDTDRAGDIIDRIRDHIKKAPPRKEQFDLNEAINEVIELGRSAIIKNGVSVQTRLSERLFPILGDRVQVQQVVLNLLLNAVEAMGSVEAKPRDLLISTEEDHTGVLVAVRDSGPGIHPAHLERVFKSFYTTKPDGTGVGLSICRSIIAAHGGRLWAEANEPRGAVFRFTLPAEPRFTSTRPRPASPHRPS
ncbi:MAG TPA: PAS domain S-box protein [Xanthobacteraceae bacterium]|nr:PAS domain S-box protein [Xanthobacteraceae bacterium]